MCYHITLGVIKMHLAAFGLFAAALIVCVILNVSVIYALLAGLLIFSLCAFKMGYGAKSIFKMMLDGIKTAKNVILSLILIGMLTALWRAAGTIPAIISYAASLIHPKTVVLMSFILNCGVSLLTGTAFGTAATMGVISMTMGIAMGADPVLLGGAIVSGTGHRPCQQARCLSASLRRPMFSRISAACCAAL